MQPGALDRPERAFWKEGGKSPGSWGRPAPRREKKGLEPSGGLGGAWNPGLGLTEANSEGRRRDSAEPTGAWERGPGSLRLEGWGGRAPWGAQAGPAGAGLEGQGSEILQGRAWVG